MSYFNVLLALRNSHRHLLRLVVQHYCVFANLLPLIHDSADLIKSTFIGVQQ